jgi:hypothetical protein
MKTSKSDYFVLKSEFFLKEQKKKKVVTNGAITYRGFRKSLSVLIFISLLKGLIGVQIIFTGYLRMLK